MSMRLPKIEWTPVRIAIGLIAGAFAIDSASVVIGERRPVGGFFEELIARFGYYGLAVLALIGGVFVGMKVGEKTRTNFLGWVSGLCAFAVIGALGTMLLASIPGVNWRFERLLESSESDY